MKSYAQNPIKRNHIIDQIKAAATSQQIDIIHYKRNNICAAHNYIIQLSPSDFSTKIEQTYFVNHVAFVVFSCKYSLKRMQMLSLEYN